MFGLVINRAYPKEILLSALLTTYTQNERPPSRPLVSVLEPTDKQVIP